MTWIKIAACETGGGIEIERDGDAVRVRESANPTQSIVTTAANWAKVAMPEGGEWTEQRGWVRDGRFIEAANGGLIRPPTHTRRVWISPAEPVATDG